MCIQIICDYFVHAIASRFERKTREKKHTTHQEIHTKFHLKFSTISTAVQAKSIRFPIFFQFDFVHSFFFSKYNINFGVIIIISVWVCLFLVCCRESLACACFFFSLHIAIVVFELVTSKLFHGEFSNWIENLNKLFIFIEVKLCFFSPSWVLTSVIHMIKRACISMMMMCVLNLTFRIEKAQKKRHKQCCKCLRLRNSSVSKTR